MKPFAIAYGAALLAFLIIDGIWLGVVAKSFYANQLGDLLRKNVLALPALAFYMLYTAGLVFLAVRPGQEGVSLSSVAMYGAVAGFLAYGTYNITNLATLRDWPALMSYVDMTWGVMLSAMVATISASVLRQFS